MDIKFCQNLKEARKSCGFTQKQVAMLLNVVESCYANWEQGRTEPNIETLRRLALVLKTNVDDLVNG